MTFNHSSKHLYVERRRLHLRGPLHGELWEERRTWFPFLEATKLLTFPDGSAASKILGVFTTDSTFKAVRDANPAMELTTCKMSGEEILNAMMHMSDPSAPEDARLTKLSIDATLVFDWQTHQRYWKRSVDIAWTQRTLQSANSSNEVDIAVSKVLGPRGQWYIVEHLQPNGTYAVSGHDLNGQAHLFVFLDVDIALRVFPDESKIQFKKADNAGLFKIAKTGTMPICLVHDCLPDGRMGFVVVDKERALRIKLDS